MVTHGLSERRALMVVQMSAASLRYVGRPDRNAALRERIVALAHRHRRYGAGMIYLKLRQGGLVVNHKRVDRHLVGGGPEHWQGAVGPAHGQSGRLPADFIQPLLG